MLSPLKVPTCCSEAWFGETFFAPFQLTELSVKVRISLLFSSLRLVIAFMITIIPFFVNRHPCIYLTTSVSF